MKNNRIFHIITDRHLRLTIGLIAAVTIFFVNISHNSIVSLLMMAWATFATTFVILSWIVIALYHPSDVKQQAKTEDTQGSVIFLLVLAAAVCSLIGIFLLLKTDPSASSHTSKTQIFLSFGSVFSSWMLIHTLFTLRYAHLFYASLSKNKDVNSTTHGLDFPGDELPDYLDFAYFSFVIGMTFQVSDIEITSKRIRRLALLHGCLSFLYNTIILALSINIISGIISNK